MSVCVWTVAVEMRLVLLLLPLCESVSQQQMTLIGGKKDPSELKGALFIKLLLIYR